MYQPQATFALSCEHKDTKGTREKVIAHRGRAKLEMMPWPKALGQHHMKTTNRPMNTKVQYNANAVHP